MVGKIISPLLTTVINVIDVINARIIGVQTDL